MAALINYFHDLESSLRLECSKISADPPHSEAPLITNTLTLHRSKKSYKASDTPAPSLNPSSIHLSSLDTHESLEAQVCSNSSVGTMTEGTGSPTLEAYLRKVALVIFLMLLVMYALICFRLWQIDAYLAYQIEKIEMFRATLNNIQK